MSPRIVPPTWESHFKCQSLLLLGLLATLSLVGCEFIPKYTADPAILAASGATQPPAGPDCMSCHSYPLHDVNHNYHLMSANVNRNNLGQPELNNVTTCLDCHYNSIRHFSYTHADTLWGDSTGQEILQHTSVKDVVLKVTPYKGYRPMAYDSEDTTRGAQLAADIDSLIFRYARLGQMVQWRTAYAHDNGSVDVSFPPNDVTSPESLATAYKPKDLSCSAVTCHNTRAATYRWMSPRRGISNCPSLDGNDTTCHEVLPKISSGGAP